MKRILCTAFVFAALFVMAACGSSQAGQEPGTSSAASTTAPAQENATEESTVETGAPAPAQESATEVSATAPTQENTAQASANAPTPENAEQEETDMKLKIQVGDTIFTATLAENSSVDALKELMADGPLTLNMSDYANMEKGADLGTTLPQNNEQMNTQPGDIILYQGRTFVIYYGTNSWSLTPIGKIDNVDAESLRAALGTGDVTVTLSIN